MADKAETPIRELKSSHDKAHAPMGKSFFMDCITGVVFSLGIIFAGGMMFVNYLDRTSHVTYTEAEWLECENKLLTGELTGTCFYDGPGHVGPITAQHQLMEAHHD